jgi:predicted restriction endonuclease
MKTFEMGRINDMPKFLEIVQDYYDHHLVKNEYRSEEIVAQVRNLVSECPISKISRFQVCHIIPHADINNGLVKYEETVGNYIPLCDTIHKMFDDRLFYFQYDGDVLRIQLSPSLLERDKSDLHHAGVIDGAKVELPYRLSDECLAYRKNMVING